MNPLDTAGFLTNFSPRSDAYNKICRASQYSAGNYWNCFQIGEDERATTASWFTEAFKQAMERDKPDPAVWLRVERAIGLFRPTEIESGWAKRWSDLTREGKEILLPSFLPALVIAAGIAYVNPSEHFARFYYGVRCSDMHPHRLPKEIAPLLLEKLSTPSAKKHELQDIFWDALRYESERDGHHGVKIEGALPLTGSQLASITYAEGAKPAPNTLLKTVTIDDKPYSLTLLLTRSSVAKALYEKTGSIEDIVALLQKRIPDLEARTIALNYCTLSKDDFYIFMRQHVRPSALNELRALCGKMAATFSSIGAPKIKAEELMSAILSYWLKGEASWSVTVTKALITLSCDAIEKASDSFIQLIKQSRGYTFVLTLDFRLLPQAIRDQFTDDLPIISITQRQRHDKWRTDAEVDPLLATLTRLESLSINSPVASVHCLKDASQLKELKIVSLQQNGSENLLPSAIENLEISISGKSYSCTLPTTLKKLTLSVAQACEFALPNIPEGIEEVTLWGHTSWVSTVASKLPTLRNLTKLNATLSTKGHKRHPMRILEQGPSLIELTLHGDLTLQDLGTADQTKLQKLTFLPYAAKMYAAEPLLEILRQISTLKDFITIGPYGPFEHSKSGGSELGFDDFPATLLAIAKAALAANVHFTINSKTPQFLVDNVKTAERRRY